MGFGGRPAELATSSTGPQFHPSSQEARQAREAVDMRRRSVDDSQPDQNSDLQAVRAAWKGSPARLLESSSSSSSSSSWAGSEARDTARDGAIRDGAGAGIGAAVVVVAFDAHTKASGVCAAVVWALQNAAMAPGDELVLVGVMDTVRGPLGYTVQVHDQTFLGANARYLDAEVGRKSAALCRQFQKLCAAARVKLVVRVRAATRPEVAVVHEATARGASHVVLDKSLHSKRRHYYVERLACAVTRVRRGGGVEALRTAAKLVPASPTSVLSPHRAPLPAPAAPHSFTSSFARAVSLSNPDSHCAAPTTESQPSPTRRSNPSIDEDLFCIDHDSLPRRADLQEGYESDDLFSLADYYYYDDDDAHLPTD